MGVFLWSQRDKEMKSQRVKETKRGRDKGTKSQRDKETKRQREEETKWEKGAKTKPRKPLEEYGGCAAAVMLPFWSYKSKLLTPNRQHPPSFTFYIFHIYFFQIEIHGGNFNEEIISQKEISTNRFLALAIPFLHVLYFSNRNLWRKSFWGNRV